MHTHTYSYFFICERNLLTLEMEDSVGTPMWCTWSCYYSVRCIEDSDREKTEVIRSELTTDWTGEKVHPNFGEVKEEKGLNVPVNYRQDLILAASWPDEMLPGTNIWFDCVQASNVLVETDLEYKLQNRSKENIFSPGNGKYPVYLELS